MSEYDNTNTGALFKNDKGDNHKRPDYKGNLNVNGQEFWISAWLRDKKDGSGKFMSLKVEQKEQPTPPRQDAHNQAKSNAYQPQPQDDDVDDIPF